MVGDLKFSIGILLILVGSFLGIYSIYRMRIKNDIIIPSILIVFVHFFVIFGIFLITKNPSLGFVAMIFYNIVFVAEIISYILKNRNINAEIEHLSKQVSEEIEFWKSVISEGHRFVDDYECFEHLLRVDRIVDRAESLSLLELVKPLLNLLKSNKNYFNNYRVSEISKRAKISKKKWWLYIDEIQ